MRFFWASVVFLFLRRVRRGDGSLMGCWVLGLLGGVWCGLYQFGRGGRESGRVVWSGSGSGEFSTLCRSAGRMKLLRLRSQKFLLKFPRRKRKRA